MKSNRKLVDQACARVELFVNPRPTISMGHFADGGGFRVELRVANLATEAQALALLQILRTAMCGDEIRPAA